MSSLYLAPNANRDLALWRERPERPSAPEEITDERTEHPVVWQIIRDHLAVDAVAEDVLARIDSEPAPSLAPSFSNPAPAPMDWS